MASDEPAAVLAQRYGVTPDTIYRWWGRTSFEDRSHTAHDLATTLTRAQSPAGHHPAPMSLTGSAPNWTSNTA